MEHCARVSYSNPIDHSGGPTRPQLHAQARVSTLDRTAAERTAQRQQQQSKHKKSMAITCCMKRRRRQRIEIDAAAAAAARRQPHAAATLVPGGEESPPHIRRPAVASRTIAGSCQMVGRRGITARKQSKQRRTGRHRRARGCVAHGLRWPLTPD